MKYEVKHPKEEKSTTIEESELKSFRTNGYVVIKAIPENIEDEDYLNGNYYPAHETWND